MGIQQTRDWDAESYDRVSDPARSSGGWRCSSACELEGDETVLDAGCGSGRVTAMLLERLPDGQRARRRRLGVDGRAKVKETLRPADVRVSGRRPRRSGGGRTGRRSSSRPPSSTGSSITICLFRRLRAALRPGGRLVAQCGGEGNIGHARAGDRCRGLPAASLSRATSERSNSPWNFAGAEETEARLRCCRLHRRRAAGWSRGRSTARAPARVHLRTVSPRSTIWLGCRRRCDGPSRKRSWPSRAEPLRLDYVRLNIEAAPVNRAERAA